MRVRNGIVGFVACLLCLAGLAACGSSSTSTSSSTAAASTAGSTAATTSAAAGNKSPVVLAINSIQVPGVTLLTDLTTGANVAVKAINAAGGFGGRKVVLETCNTLNTPGPATICAHKQLGSSPRPIAEFGCETTWSASGLPLYSAAGIPSFNCMNTTEDFHNPLSFGMVAGAEGDLIGLARFICSNPSVHSVIGMADDLPAFHSDFAPVAPVLKACGKTLINPVYYPLTAVDMTPYITHVVQAKPDFVIMLAIGPQVVLIFKAFQQNGFPASKVGGPDTDFTYSTTLKPAGSSMNGAYAASQYASWGDTSDPDVASYLSAIKAAGADPTNATIEWGYAMIEWFYTVAQKVGFANFNSATLANFMRTQTGVPIPLSRTMINPGPAQYPQQKQPYVQIAQWKDGKMTVVATGSQNDGWVYGF